MNTDDLRVSLIAAARDSPTAEDVRETVGARLHHRQLRRRAASLVGIVVAVTVVVSGVFLARPTSPVHATAQAASSSETATVLPETTLHSAHLVPRPATSKLVAFDFQPVVSPVTLTEATAPAILQTRGELFLTWMKSGSSPATPSSAGPSAAPQVTAPSGAYGYTISGQLADQPWESPSSTKHTDRTLTYRGTDALLSTYLHDGQEGRWLSWSIGHGQYVHAWMAEAANDAIITSFADRIQEHPQMFKSDLSPTLTVRSLTQQSITVSPDPSAVIRSQLALCPAGVTNPVTFDSVKCLYIQAVSSNTSGGPCSDRFARTVQSSVAGQNVVACPALQQATLYVAGQTLADGQNIFIQAPKDAGLTAADLADLASAITLTA